MFFRVMQVTVLFAGPNFPDIKTLEKEVSSIELDLPQEEEITNALGVQLETFEKNGITTSITNETRGNLVQALLGLTNDKVSNVIAEATMFCISEAGVERRCGFLRKVYFF